MSEIEIKKTGSGMKILVIVLLIIVLLNTALLAFNFLSGRPLYALPVQRQTRQSVDGECELFGPEEYTVNLADSGQRRYLKVRLVLAYEDKKLQKELERRQAQIRDLIILTLRQRTAEDLAENGGMETLRRDLKNRINAVLKTGIIKEIYFTDFLVQ
ncbi:MAG: flagellar basal body-associated FliL family protein [Firmicutes bacterium]|jgi:flagellar FliL protein|nr:flagellar basal body-associated FliL family protein [Bacillota bacterium]